MNTKYNNIIFIENNDFLLVRNTKKSLYKSLCFEAFKILIVLLLIVYLPNSKYMIFFVLGLLVGMILIFYNIYKTVLNFKNQNIIKFEKNNNHVQVNDIKYSKNELEKLLIIENTSNIDFDIISLHLKTCKKKHLIVEMSGYKQNSLINLTNHLNNYLKLPIERKNV